jgi:hypothetical protein
LWQSNKPCNLNGPDWAVGLGKTGWGDVKEQYGRKYLSKKVSCQRKIIFHMAPLRAEGLAYALRDSHFKSGETAECQTCILIAEQLVERAKKKSAINGALKRVQIKKSALLNCLSLNKYPPTTDATLNERRESSSSPPSSFLLTARVRNHDFFYF